MLKSAQNSNSQKGFTLIELLIVIVIIGVLAGIVITIINPAKQRDRARDAVLVATIDKMSAEAQAFSNSDISGVGTYPTCAQMALNLKNIASSVCGVSAGTLVVSSVTIGTGGAFTGFRYTPNGVTGFCIAVTANDQTGGLYLKYNYPSDAVPVRITVLPGGC